MSFLKNKEVKVIYNFIDSSVFKPIIDDEIKDNME